MEFLNLKNLKFEGAELIGKQLAELIAKIENSKFPTASFGSVLQSKAEKEFVEQAIKASNEHFQNEAAKKRKNSRF